MYIHIYIYTHVKCKIYVKSNTYIIYLEFKKSNSDILLLYTAHLDKSITFPFLILTNNKITL